MQTKPKNELTALSQKMQIVANNYFFAWNVLLKNYDLDDDTFYLFIIYMQKVKEAFEALSQIEKRFLNYEYFYQAYPRWWKDSLSNYRYARIKRESIKHFLEVFYVSFK